MSRRKAHPAAAALIVSSLMIAGFCFILKSSGIGKSISGSFEGGAVSSSEAEEEAPEGENRALIFTKPFESFSDPERQQKYKLDLENICQNPELPTGCEVTALTTALRFYGLPADKEELALSYLPKQDFEELDGIRYGADPKKAFAGDPFNDYSYGAFSGAIERAANDYLSNIGSPLKAHAYQDKDLSFFTEQVEGGAPALVWVTIDLKESYISDSWLTKDGSEIYWQANEHCMVLAGFDEARGVVFCADPLKDTPSLTAYPIEQFAKSFYEMGAQGIIFK